MTIEGAVKCGDRMVVRIDGVWHHLKRRALAGDVETWEPTGQTNSGDGAPIGGEVADRPISYRTAGVDCPECEAGIAHDHA